MGSLCACPGASGTIGKQPNRMEALMPRQTALPQARSCCKCLMSPIHALSPTCLFHRLEVLQAADFGQLQAKVVLVQVRCGCSLPLCFGQHVLSICMLSLPELGPACSSCGSLLLLHLTAPTKQPWLPLRSLRATDGRQQPRARPRRSGAAGCCRLRAGAQVERPASQRDGAGQQRVCAPRCMAAPGAQPANLRGVPGVALVALGLYCNSILV